MWPRIIKRHLETEPALKRAEALIFIHDSHHEVSSGFESGQCLWSAPAERSGDGALGHAGIVGSGGPPDGIYDRAVSRFACHRTP
jgi:hypothetical protein